MLAIENVESCKIAFSALRYVRSYYTNVLFIGLVLEGIDYIGIIG